ncbi:MAG: serine protease [Candidatus Colwellbacteria bacterium]|nr:serine protease [Candidatus Colwellbacteria bacterium]
MDKIEICEKIKKTIRRLVLFDGDKIVGAGTGVVIKDTGELLTANHVIRRYPTLSDPKISAYGMGDIPKTGYKPLLMNIALNINISEYAKPLVIDLAVLGPTEKQSNLPFMELDDNNAVEGEEVIMAGFPDEIKPPLNFNKMLNFNNPELEKQRDQIENFFKYLMQLVMMKSGMIGSTQGVKLNSNKVNIPGFPGKTIDVEGAVYWIDNASTHGASGGPVVNSFGKLIGIVCEKGTTEDPNFDVEIPSGSTMALSHRLVTWFLE